MKALTTLLLLCSLFLAACREKDPPDETVSGNGPVFHLKGDIDGQPQTFEAGVNNFYMNTLSNKDGMDVYEFTGELQQTCKQCKKNLRITLRNYQQNSGSNNFIPDSSFNPGVYTFLFDDAPVNGYRVDFKAQATGTGTVTHFWNFGDSTQSNQANPQKTFAPGKYKITYTASYSNGCGSSASYTLNLLPNMVGRNNAGFGYTYIDNNQVFLYTDSSSGTYFWDLGQGQFSTAPSLVMQLDSGVRGVSFSRIYANKDTVKSFKNIAPLQYLLCNANFSHFAQGIYDKLNLSQVYVDWTDASGKTYSSRKVVQPSNQHFRILSSSPYRLDKQGKRTYKLKVEFSCLVSDGTQTIPVNMQGFVAVGLP